MEWDEAKERLDDASQKYESDYVSVSRHDLRAALARVEELERESRQQREFKHKANRRADQAQTALAQAREEIGRLRKVALSQTSYALDQEARIDAALAQVLLADEQHRKIHPEGSDFCDVCDHLDAIEEALRGEKEGE